MSSNTYKRLGRKIKVEGLTYHWKVESGPYSDTLRVTVRLPNNKQVTANASEVVGKSDVSFGHGQEHGSKSGMITPAMVAAFIKKEMGTWTPSDNPLVTMLSKAGPR